jgi:hypothetical protein
MSAPDFSKENKHITVAYLMLEDALKTLRTWKTELNELQLLRMVHDSVEDSLQHKALEDERRHIYEAVLLLIDQRLPR